MSTVLESGMYISLKNEDAAVLENDIELFRTNSDAPDNRYKFSVNGFMNRVFVNMYDGRKFNRSSVKRTRKKGAKGFNVKLNKAVVGKMEQSGLDIENDHSSDFAAFYVSFIEKYCKMNLLERSEIFFKSLISDLNNEMLHYFIKIKKNDGWDTYILPYAIKNSDENSKMYLTGFALRKTDDGYIYKTTVCLPLNKILGSERVTRLDPEKQIAFEEGSGIQSYEDMKQYIEERFCTDGILYLSDILRDVRVRLSDKGRDDFFSRTQYRPSVYTWDENDSNVVCFRATNLHTFMYFFKFGSDAEILEPPAYRQHFLEKYEKAYLKYAAKTPDKDGGAQ